MSRIAAIWLRCSSLRLLLHNIIDRSERILITANGEHVPILKSIARENLKGHLVLIETFVDISDRKIAEDALSRANRQLNLMIFQVTRVSIIRFLPARTVISRNTCQGKDRNITGYLRARLPEHPLRHMDFNPCSPTEYTGFMDGKTGDCKHLL